MKSRNSNIELLRLLCIVMIISMHVFGLFSSNLETAGLAALSINNAVCNMAVSIFMLISGYYGIHFSKNKLLGLWNIAFFWSIALIAIDVDHSTKNLFRSFFPVLTGKYWFLTTYIILFFLAPYIEKMLNQIPKNQFQFLIGTLLLFFTFAPSFLMIEIMHDSGKGIMNMLTVYLIGRYMAFYGLPKKLSGQSGRIILLISITTIAMIDFIVEFKLESHFQMLSRDNSLLILLGSTTVFTMVMQIRPRTVIWINTLANYVFPIYVIQGVLYKHALVPEEMSSILYVMVWLNSIAITLIALFMEFLRRLLLNKLFDWLMTKELLIIEKAKNHILSVQSEIV